MVKMEKFEEKEVDLEEIEENLKNSKSKLQIVKVKVIC